MKLAMVGAGGVGGYFAARLAEAGVEITLIARGEHLQAIRAEGLEVESPLGDVRVQIAATDAPAEVGVVDAVLVATKTWQLAAAAQEMQPLVGPQTLVVPLQNGVEASADLERTLDRGAVGGGVCRIISLRSAPGRIQHVGADPSITFGARKPEDAAAAADLGRVLSRASGMQVEVSESIEVEVWKKFLFLVSVSSVGAVTGAPIGVLRSVPETRAMLTEAMEEIHRLAVTRGIPLPAEAVGAALQFIDSLPPEGTTSLQRDLAEGRRSELEHQSGAVVRLAGEAKIPVPVHRFFYASLLPREWAAQGKVEWPG